MQAFKIEVRVNGTPMWTGAVITAANEREARFGAISKYIEMAPWDEGQTLTAVVVGG